ncbi:hypothetical protein L218DRAFT_177863 [Marasmius fiardii PR-910]|nr:hypothetical protein L218DRAFT_177863 [Marasmius fiardii PR-910]
MILSRLSPSDSRLCHWLARFSLWPTFHFNAKCECGKPVMGSRLLQLRSDPTPHFEELCQHQASSSYTIVAQQEACLKIVHFLHRRDQYPLLMKTDSLFEFVYALSSRSASPEDYRVVVSSESVFPPHRRSSVVSSRHTDTECEGSVTLPGIRERATSVLLCVGCGADVPDENSDGLWVCLVCSVPESAEKLLILCSRCECTNRRWVDGRFPTHSVYHSLLHVRPWLAKNANVAYDTRFFGSLSL